MSTINAPTLADIAYSGDCPAAHIHGSITLASAQVGDKIRLSKVFAGTKVYSAKLINAALGASTTVSLGFEYVNGEAGGSATAFLPATSTAAAASTHGASAPVTLAYDAYIIATIGGGAATGKIDSVLGFEFKGK